MTELNSEVIYLFENKETSIYLWLIWNFLMENWFFVQYILTMIPSPPTPPIFSPSPYPHKSTSFLPLSLENK